MNKYKITFYGCASIADEEIPIETNIEIEAENETEARDKAYAIAKQAYLTWEFIIK